MQTLIDLQNAIVLSIANAIKVAWVAAVVNIEIDEMDGEQTENCLALAFTEHEGTWERHSFCLPSECYALFVALQEASDQWKSCTLEFDSTGKYKFSYSHQPPKRLNGVLDDESMLKGYLPPNR